MYVHSLTLNGFRNLESRQVQFPERVCVITGRNGQGKTSLLEAVYLLAHPKSFRTSKIRELVSWAPEAGGRCFVEAKLSSDDGSKTLSYEIEGGKRTVFLNEKRIETLRGFYGQLIAVVFTPDELQLVKGAPQQRRAFLDRTLAMVDPGFVEDAVQYQRALKNRNAILAGRGGDGSNDDLALWDELLIRYGSAVAAKRRQFVTLLGGSFVDYYERVLRHGEKELTRERVTLELESDFEIKGEPRAPEALREEFRKHTERDRRQRSTSFGVHRDDLALTLDTGYGRKSARASASQGQARSIALALKFCAVDFLKARSGEDPVLLLDDVESELDPARRSALYELLGGFNSQVFLSTTEPFSGVKNLSDDIGYKTILDGRIEPV